MPKSARFFLSRITKSGTLDIEKILTALRETQPINSQKYAWTVVDVLEDNLIFNKQKFRYLSGKLVKYDPDGIVEVIDEASHKVRSLSEPNMQRAASMFIYLPDESIFGHRLVWNEIKPNDFRTQISALIIEYHEKFFVGCELNPVADLSRFLTKLGTLSELTQIKARVVPPNPLFGLFWENLKIYMEERRLSQLALKEVTKSGQTLPSVAPEIARQIESEDVTANQSAPIGDAAILMAADGYGSAEITGRTEGGKEAVIKTSENAIQLKLDADITAAELAAALVQKIVRLNKSRKLTH